MILLCLLFCGLVLLNRIFFRLLSSLLLLLFCWFFVGGVDCCLVVICIFCCSILKVDLWFIFFLYLLYSGEWFSRLLCLLLLIGFICEQGVIIIVCLIIDGLFFLLRKEISVLLVFSFWIVCLVLKVGLVCMVWVVVFIVFWFFGVKVCRVCCMWLFSWLSMVLGIFVGFCEIKQMLMFLEWIRWIICLILFSSICGVLLNSRCVLLKKNISFGLLRLLVFGRCLQSLESIYSRLVVYSFGIWQSFLVLRILIIFLLLVLMCIQLVIFSIGLLKKCLVFCCFRVNSLCWMVLIEVLLILLYWFWKDLVLLLINWVMVWRFLKLSSSRLWLFVMWKIMFSMLFCILLRLSRCVSSRGLRLEIVVCIGWFFLLKIFQSIIGLVCGFQLLMLIFFSCVCSFFEFCFVVVMLVRLFLMLVINIGMLIFENDLVSFCRVMVLLVLVVLVISLWWLVIVGSKQSVLFSVCVINRGEFMVDFFIYFVMIIGNFVVWCWENCYVLCMLYCEGFRCSGVG